ncbi:MAG: acyl-CoA dehydrogenase family protein, partial [Acidimicrobiia bacterium]
MSADVPAHLQLREVLGDIMPKHRATWGDSHEWAALLDFQTALGAAGWAAPGWPVEYGGKGLSVEELTACAAEFYKARCPRQIAVFGTANVGPTIMVNGTAEQKKYLARMLTAEDVWCQGFSEPDFGSDLAGLKTKAEIDGDEFVINGAKIWTSVGLNATHCMLLVRTDPDAPTHKGISALLIRLDLPGIDRRPIKQLNGLSEFAEMHFDNVRVPR